MPLPVTVAYDANGNTLSDAQGRSFTWDFENRLVQAVVPGTNGGTTTFKYDPWGRRIYKSSPTWTGIFTYDGVSLIETINSSGSEAASYTQGPLIDEPLAELRGSTTDYYAADGLGSITSLSSSTGTLANTYTYDSFGNLANSTGTLRNPFQYTGREFDQETGIYYYRARYYDPSAGRFSSEDPLRFAEGPNFYRYVENDPVDHRDPFGLATYQCGCDLIGPLQPTAGECLYTCVCSDNIFAETTVLFNMNGYFGLKKRCGASISCPKRLKARKRTLFGITVYVPDFGSNF